MGNRSNINLVGNTTQGQNIGTGDGVYKGKSVGNILQYKTLSVTGSTMIITTDENNIYFSANTGGGGIGGIGTLQDVTGSGCTTTNGMVIGNAGAESNGTTAFAQGYDVNACGSYSHAEGYNTLASGDTSHAEGNSTQSICDFSHAEGSNTCAFGNSSHAEGFCTIASGDYSHAEGSYACATGYSSHAEGNYGFAFGLDSHAEGIRSIAYGTGSHSEGGFTCACGNFSHAEGCCTVAFSNNSHVSGRYNCGCDNTIAEIGVGSSIALRCNAFEVYCNGQVALPQLTGKTGSESCVVYIDSAGKLTHGTSGGGTSYTFQQSIAESSGTVNLCNDNATPGNSKYYGTSSGGVKGFFDLPSGGLSSIAANSILSNSTTSSAVPTELQIADEEIVGRVNGGNVTGVTMVDIYDLSSTTKSLLSTTGNWSSKIYTGTAITDGDAGKMYFDSNYMFYFKTDNTPVRIALI